MIKVTYHVARVREFLNAVRLSGLTSDYDTDYCYGGRQRPRRRLHLKPEIFSQGPRRRGLGAHLKSHLGITSFYWPKLEVFKSKRKCWV